MCACVLRLPEGGHAVAGGPAHDEAPLGAGASLAHLVQAAGRPHLTHPDLGLQLEVAGRPVGGGGGPQIMMLLEQGFPNLLGGDPKNNHF